MRAPPFLCLRAAHQVGRTAVASSEQTCRRAVVLQCQVPRRARRPRQGARSRGARVAGGLPVERSRVTLSYMKTATVTVRLDVKIQRELDRLSRELGRSRSDIVRDAVRRQVALLRFERSRRGLLPLAEAQGILTDEDVFRIVS